ncbi:hypothetical protein [Streptomyces adelaidensis]|uniref:hypothetical protein n=1 Tax=Streptomyces adelaidensis TaxID=2796465 RepID=UPI00190601BE|nr:hypothetical protein [Streptomyces adelaidensis]
MPVLTADRTPDQLVEELGRLIGLDWPTLWAGVPEDEEKLAPWCAGFGWRPLWFEAGQWVRTAHGGQLYLASVAPGRPVTRVEHVLWSVRSGSAAENAAVMTLVSRKWPSYLAAAQAVLSTPVWSGDWDTDGFPEAPGRAYWRDEGWRREHRDPYRLAVWFPRTPGAPMCVLRANLSAGTAAGWGPGGATISLACHGPADPEDDGSGWLL